jgi:peptidoglycan/xylan/chitin deacetylase (PgdA/CDA1 family)
VTPDGGDAQVPPPPHPAYIWAVQLGHRLQARLAARRGGDIPRTCELRILCYHRVSSERDRLAVRPDVFRAQMERLLELAEVVSVSDVPRLLAGDAAGRYVCVSFDDGYHDFLTDALPVLRELGVPAAVFVPCAAISGEARFRWYRRQPALLSWPELEELAHDPLVAVGAHSVSHPALPRLSDAEAWYEIDGSRRELLRRLSVQVQAFAYPAGLYGEREARMVRAAGFDVGVTTDPGVNRPGARPETLRRHVVDREDDLRMFTAKVIGLLDAPWGIRRKAEL